MTYNEAAKKYNTTPDKIRQAQIDFACSEGFDGAGNEYNTLDEWLDRTFGKSSIQAEPFEPRHKGDEYPE